MEEDTERGYFEYKETSRSAFADGDLLEATAGDHGISISVTEEKAVGSLNEEFTCTATLPRADAIRFRDWLNEMLKEV